MSQVKISSTNSKSLLPPVKSEEQVVNSKSSQKVTVFQGESHSTNMCKVLNDLRLQGVCCDVDISVHRNPNSARNSTDRIVYKTHGVILTARSAFFRQFFTTPEPKSHLTFILPSYVNPRSLEIILQYMYTGRLSIRMDTVTSIYQIGWLFQMEDVLTLCTQFCKMKKFKPPPVTVNINSEKGLNNSDKLSKSSGFKTDDTDVEKKNEKGISEYEENQPMQKNEENDEKEENSLKEKEKIIPEMSLLVKQKNGSELQLAAGPPEIIECTPIIMDEKDLKERDVGGNDGEINFKPNDLDSIDDILNSTSRNEKRDLKLVIFKPNKLTESNQHLLEENDDLSQRHFDNDQNYQNDADSVVVSFNHNVRYPSPVLYVLAGIKSYLPELIKFGFFHVEFHVENACRKGVVKTDGKLVCVMFGQVNHFFPINHEITEEDIFRYRPQQKEEDFGIDRKPSYLNYIISDQNESCDPIFGKENDSEKDVLHCFACSCVFFTIQGKASHLLRHHREILHWDKFSRNFNYKCSACQFKCQNLRQLYFHRHENHLWVLPEVVLQFRCGLCFTSHISINAAWDHLRNSHNISKNETNFNFDEIITPDKEVDVKKRGGKLVKGEEEMEVTEVFECSQCKKRLRNQEMLVIHEKTHNSGGKPYKCILCNYKSGYAGNLKLHISKKHSSDVSEISKGNESSLVLKRRRRRRRKKNY